MNNIEEQIKALKASWAKAYEGALSNPTAWKPHLQNTSIQSLDEAVSTIDTWLNRLRAPTGFSPGFQIAKATASVFLPQLLAASQNLEAAQYNHFPSFVNALTNTLAAIHTMAVYSDKDTSQLNADLSAHLSQALSLLNTAQHELAEKKELLAQTVLIAAEIEKAHSTITEQAKSADDSAVEISESKQQSEDHLKEIVDLLDAAKSHDTEFQDLLANNKKLNANLVKMAEELKRLQEQNKKQEQIIDSILPRGASAGLAAAFSTRGRKLELGKWIWMTVFVSSLTGLAVFAWKLTGFQPTNQPGQIDFWAYLASRLPLAAPLVWLGWFSAIQYGNTIRVQEDYAFKEATSKAFQGYRDHMEHMANVQLNEAQTALTLLSTKTIDILSHEPLRIYGRTEQDATPAHGFAKILQFGNKNKTTTENAD